MKLMFNVILPMLILFPTLYFTDASSKDLWPMSASMGINPLLFALFGKHLISLKGISYFSKKDWYRILLITGGQAILVLLLIKFGRKSYPDTFISNALPISIFALGVQINFLTQYNKKFKQLKETGLSI